MYFTTVIRKTSAVLTAICIASASITASAQQNASESENEEFNQFLNSEFVAAMESDYMSMHYTVADYQKYGIEKPEPTIGDATLESYQESVEEAQKSLDSLEQFDYSSLSTSQQHDYDAYAFYLKNTIDLNSYPMMDQIFSPSSGIQENLLTNFTEFVFREKEDVDDYLSVLSSVDQFLQEGLEVTKQQAAQGQFLTDSALDDTLSGISKFTAKKDDNPLIVIFDEDMDQCDFLSEQEKEDYKKQNQNIVLNQYIPAYENLANELEKLRGSRSYEGGYAAQGEDGLAFYTALVRSKTSSDDSIKDLFDLCTQFMSDAIYEYAYLYQTNGNIEQEYEEETVEETTPEEILSYLQDHMEDFPEGPKVTYTPSYLDDSVANDTTMAYYMQPPIDDLHDNVIKINGSNVQDTNTLYETLAHEGFPGHLYQITWYLNTSPSPLRAAISAQGYTEGWGMYAEMDAWDHSGLDSDVNTMHKLDVAIGYVENAAVDLAVNGLDYTKQDLSDWMDDLGLNTAGIDSLYDYVVDNPGLILPYGVGLAEFMTIRADARQTLGDDFDIRAFNTVLLTYGDRPFSSVKQDVNNWIKQQGKQGLDFSSHAQEEQQAQEATIPEIKTRVITICLVLAAAIVCAIVALHHARKNDPFE